ncbi:MAG TPA: hypothetical protein VGI59_08675 [Candidatus Udaeobacter sp.]
MILFCRRRLWNHLDSAIGRRQRVTFLEASQSKDTNIQCLVMRPIEEGQEAEIAAVQRPIITFTRNRIEKTNTHDKSA